MRTLQVALTIPSRFCIPVLQQDVRQLWTANPAAFVAAIARRDNPAQARRSAAICLLTYSVLTVPPFVWPPAIFDGSASRAAPGYPIPEGFHATVRLT